MPLLYTSMIRHGQGDGLFPTVLVGHSDQNNVGESHLVHVDMSTIHAFGYTLHC